MLSVSSVSHPRSVLLSWPGFVSAVSTVGGSSENREIRSPFYAFTISQMRAVGAAGCWPLREQCVCVCVCVCARASAFAHLNWWGGVKSSSPLISLVKWDQAVWEMPASSRRKTTPVSHWSPLHTTDKQCNTHRVICSNLSCFIHSFIIFCCRDAQKGKSFFVDRT